MDGKWIFCKEDGEAFAQTASDFTRFRRKVFARAGVQALRRRASRLKIPA